MLASNITWNAYNNFGGRSNYINADGLPPTPTVNARPGLKRYTDPDARHLRAPTTTPRSRSTGPSRSTTSTTAKRSPTRSRAGRPATSPRPSGGCSAGWSARDFAYDYYAETQLHDGTLDLDAYRVLILSTHPEYWSRRMYDARQAWVFERGRQAMYLGGNGLNCEVEFARRRARMICRNGDDPRAVSRRTSARRAGSHMRVESEANLLGVVFDPRGIMTGAPYRVVDGAHWVFDGTGLKTGDLFGGRVCTGAARAAPRGTRRTRSRHRRRRTCACWRRA